MWVRSTNYTSKKCYSYMYHKVCNLSCARTYTAFTQTHTHTYTVELIFRWTHRASTKPILILVSSQDTAPLSLTLCQSIPRTKHYYRFGTALWWLLVLVVVVVEGVLGGYDNTHCTASPTEYHSLGIVFIIMAIICLCNGSQTWLKKHSQKRKAGHATPAPPE